MGAATSYQFAWSIPVVAALMRAIAHEKLIGYKPKICGSLLPQATSQGECLIHKRGGGYK